MSELFASPFFGIALSILAFWVGVRIQKKTGLVVCNPLLIGIVLVVGVLLLFRIPYESYHQGGGIITMFLARRCLPGGGHLRENPYSEGELAAHSGWVRGGLGVLHGQHPSALPPVWAGRGHDRVPPAQIRHHPHCHQRIPGPRRHRPHHRGGGADHKLFRVKDPMTAGLAIGASSHAVGTSKALELGETEGAMSGLAIGVCGLITVVLSLFLM